MILIISHFNHLQSSFYQRNFASVASERALSWRQKVMMSRATFLFVMEWSAMRSLREKFDFNFFVLSTLALCERGKFTFSSRLSVLSQKCLIFFISSFFPSPSLRDISEQKPRRKDFCFVLQTFAMEIIFRLTNPEEPWTTQEYSYLENYHVTSSRGVGNPQVVVLPFNWFSLTFITLSVSSGHFSLRQRPPKSFCSYFDFNYGFVCKLGLA